MSFSVKTNTQSSYTFIELKDENTGCIAEIFALGALLNAFHIPTKKGLVNIIDGFETAAEAAANTTNGFKSSKLSPFVCRMNNGNYTFNNNNYSIEKFYLEPHAIHGIIYDAVFEVISTNANDAYAEVILEYNYTATDKGYPFNYTTTVIWQLKNNFELSVTTTVQHNNATTIPFADGWHPYFVLGETVDDCTLQFDSNEQVEFDATLIPTGNIIADNRFENGSLLKGIELDNCFKLSKPGSSVCVLKNETLQLTISPNAAYPFLQVYTPPHRKSIAIENLSAAPDAFNNKMGLLLLEPNKTYTFTTTYAVQNLQ